MDRLNQWLSVIANIGVLVGIGFLLIEINQNTDAIHASTFQGTTDALNEINIAIATDPDLIRIFSGGSTQDAADEARFSYVMLAVFRVRETVFYQKDRGTTAQELWERMEPAIELNLRSQEVRNWLRNNRYGFTQEFSAWIDQKIKPFEKADDA